MSGLISYYHKYTVPSHKPRLDWVTHFVMPGLTRKKVRPGTGRETGLGHPFFGLKRKWTPGQARGDGGLVAQDGALGSPEIKKLI